MAISANTTQALRFLRRFSGNMEPPILKYVVGETSQAWRKGDGVVIAGTPDGKVNIATGAAATGIIIAEVDGSGLVGFFYAPSSEAPPFPIAAGVQGLYTSPASLTDDDPIPEDEKIEVVLALQDVMFYAHQTNGATDITAPIRNPSAAGTGGVGVRNGLWVGTPTGETSRVMVDTSTNGTGNLLALIHDWAYPQIKEARGTGAGADPYRINTGASGTSNPAVEISIIGSTFNNTV